MGKNSTTLAQCQNCEATGEGASAWGGWCHDCDNQYGEE